MADLENQTREALAIIRETNQPVTLKFDDVVYKITTNTGKNLKPDERVILKGISGAVLPGEILVMLGPSGSGKTTLLSALGGRLGGVVEGEITYNGKPFSSSINRNTGFVTQDDMFYPNLTVTETLVFAALLRLPNTLSKEEKIRQAETVITKLGLTKCKNNIMGGPFVRGISGGERKRVSIGQEMLINPSLLFLDEPTSGLDSTSAHRIVLSLLDLARGGRSIVMAIHQPSSRLFYMFDKVLLLSDGSPLYFGRGDETMNYFSRIGYTPSVAMNPSDFLLDLANGVYLGDPVESDMAVKDSLASAYKSNLADRLKEELQQIGNNDKLQEGGIISKEFDRWATTWTQQFLVLLKRDLIERKHEGFSYLKIFQILFMAFFLGLLWWKSTMAHIQDQIGLLFYCSLFWGLLPFFDAVFAFPEVRTMLAKERSSRMYRLSAFYMARTMGDLPMELILPTVFVTITYWMVGLKPTAGSFFETLFAILYCVLASQSLGLAVGALFMDFQSSITFGTVFVQSVLLASGFYVQHIPVFISWFKYISFTYYSYKLLLGSQYRSDDMYPCGINESCRVGSLPAIQMMGLDNKALSVLALGIMIIGCRVLAYISLTRVGAKHS